MKTYRVNSDSSLRKWLDWITAQYQAHKWLEFSEPRIGPDRNLEQNKKMWAMMTDLSRQLQWYGEKLTPEHWKELLSHEWKAQKVVPGISGGFCALGARTSKMSRRQMAELIEITYAFGASNGVVWSEESKRVIEDARKNDKAEDVQGVQG